MYNLPVPQLPSPLTQLSFSLLSQAAQNASRTWLRYDFFWFFLHVLSTLESCLYFSALGYYIVLIVFFLNFILHLGALGRQRPFLICLWVINTEQNLWHITNVQCTTNVLLMTVFEVNTAKSVRNYMWVRKRNFSFSYHQQNPGGLD